MSSIRGIEDDDLRSIKERIDRLRSIIERIQLLNEEEEKIKCDKKEIFAEAKANGYNLKNICKVIALLKLQPVERENVCKWTD